GDEAARAEALFHEGRDAMTAGDYVKACSKFEASQKLLRGPGTLLNLGDCYEKSGWPAKAYRAYREAVRLAVEMKKPDRERAAQARMRAVSPKIHLVQFTGAQDRLAATIDGAATDL